jgi:hypothetical protein
MRLLKPEIIGALGAILLVPVSGRATSRSEPAYSVSFVAVPGPEIAQPLISTLSPALLVAEGPDRKKAAAPSGRGSGEGGSFDKFGHSVVNGAKRIGHSVEGGAKDVGRSIVEGWDSFKRNVIGR